MIVVFPLEEITWGKMVPFQISCSPVLLIGFSQAKRGVA